MTDAYAQWSKEGKSGRPLSARTVRHAHDLLRGMLNYAVRREMVVRNVASLVSEDLPKAEKPDHPRLPKRNSSNS